MSTKRFTRKVVAPVRVEKKVVVNPLEVEREKMITDLRKKLLTNRQLKQGGPGVRGRYELEKGYVANVDEINILGKKLGKANVSLGTLRK